MRKLMSCTCRKQDLVSSLRLERCNRSLSIQARSQQGREFGRSELVAVDSTAQCRQLLVAPACIVEHVCDKITVRKNFVEHLGCRRAVLCTLGGRGNGCETAENNVEH